MVVSMALILPLLFCMSGFVFPFEKTASSDRAGSAGRSSLFRKSERCLKGILFLDLLLDFTAQHIKTDKIVVCCPAYGDNDEKWRDTPETNAAGLSNYGGFHQNCKHITSFIDAPYYIFVGPTKESKNSCGLFSKRTSNDMFYPEYLHGCYDYNIDLELKH